MKMLGTERWWVISSRASWIAAPSSVCGVSVNAIGVGEYVLRLTNLVELEDVGLCARLAEESLSGLAVRAVRLGEDGCRTWIVSGLLRMPSTVVETYRLRWSR